MAGSVIFSANLAWRQQNMIRRMSWFGSFAALLGMSLSAGAQEAAPNNAALEQQVRQQIAMRRIAFAAPRIDRTRDIIIRMNNAYSPQSP